MTFEQIIAVAVLCIGLFTSAIGCIVWFVRLEGRMNALKESHDRDCEDLGRLRENVEHGERGRHDFEKEIRFHVTSANTKLDLLMRHFELQPSSPPMPRLKDDGTR